MNTAHEAGPRGGWRENILALATALAFLGAVYLPPIAAQGADFLFGRSDLWGYFAPMAFYLDTCLSQGAWPQWNPHILCGTPFAANPQAAAYYPPHLLRGVLHALLPGPPGLTGTVASLALMVALHQAALALGAFRFARRSGLCVLSSGATMLLFLGASECVFRSVQHWAFIAHAAWLPWILLALQAALRGPGWRDFVWHTGRAGIFFGMTVLIGFPQLSLYLGAFVGLYAVAFTLSQAKRFDMRQLARAVCAVAAVAVIGAITALPLLYPAVELAAHAPRAKDAGSAGAIEDPRLEGLLQDPAAALQIALLYPGSHGVRLLGAVAAMLALCAVRSRQPGRATVWAILLLAMLDACLGPPLPLAAFLAWIAPFHIAEPQRAAIFAAFALAMLAGHGVDALARPRASRFSVTLWAVALGALGAGAAFALLEWEFTDPVYQITPLVLAAQITGLAAIALACAAPRHRPWLTATAVLASAAELAIWGGARTQKLVADDTLDRALYNGEYIRLETAEDWSLENRRVFRAAWLENAPIWDLEYGMTGYDPLMLGAVRQRLCAPRTEPLYNRRISAVEVTGENTWGPSLLKRVLWLADSPGPGQLPAKDAFFTPIHASAIHSIVPESTRTRRPLTLKRPPAGIDWHGVVMTELFEAPLQNTALALTLRTSVAGSAEVILPSASPTPDATRTFTWTKPENGLVTIEAPLFEPPMGSRNTVARVRVAEDAAAATTLESAELWTDTDDLNEKIAIVNAGPNHLEARLAALPAPRWLIFTTPAYPGWRATLDGAEAPIVPAYGAFQAIEVPAGTHVVRFRFNSQRIWTGLAAGAAGVILVLSAMLIARLGGPTRSRASA